MFSRVATVLTACGIETANNSKIWATALQPLQQYLPLAVLKRGDIVDEVSIDLSLQQYLPLAVLKRLRLKVATVDSLLVATVLTACGIETDKALQCFTRGLTCCNSTYRLRY